MRTSDLIRDALARTLDAERCDLRRTIEAVRAIPRQAADAAALGYAGSVRVCAVAGWERLGGVILDVDPGDPYTPALVAAAMRDLDDVLPDDSDVRRARARTRGMFAARVHDPSMPHFTVRLGGVRGQG